jgi:hypothetical protein
MDERASNTYFVYGRQYIAPAIYVRVDSDGQSFIVDPSGKEERTTAPVSRWLERVASGWMAEATKEAIAAAIEEWNRSERRPQLRLP